MTLYREALLFRSPTAQLPAGRVRYAVGISEHEPPHGYFPFHVCRYDRDGTLVGLADLSSMDAALAFIEDGT